jgi:hypothetical protein
MTASTTVLLGLSPPPAPPPARPGLPGPTLWLTDAVTSIRPARP